MNVFCCYLTLECGYIVATHVFAKRTDGDGWNKINAEKEINQNIKRSLLIFNPGFKASLTYEL